MSFDVLELTPDELKQTMLNMGQKAFRCKQLLQWVYEKSVTDPKQMSNMPGSLIAKFNILTSQIAAESRSADGCVKLLLALRDGNHIETVMIPDANRATACVSTQAGCAMGCAFCASGINGLQRNLTSGEIIEQILHLQQASDRKITNVVFMGMGEPLANYDATVKAVKAIIDPQRLGISARKVTVSTVGLPSKIRALADEDLPITLAISLHAPHDALREKLIPLASQHKIEEIIDAARHFFEARKREVTLEYILLGDVNDTMLCADALSKIAHSLRSSVNLISYNPVSTLPFKRPSKKAVQAFENRLIKNGVNVHLRKSRGLDADAACGQLRKRILDESAGE